MFDVKVTSFILIKILCFLITVSVFFSVTSHSITKDSAKEVISAIPLDNQSCPVVE